MAQVSGVCYSSKDAALTALASANIGQVVTLGTSSYVVDAAPVLGASSITYTLTPIASGVPIVKVVPVTVPDCQMLDWGDGLLLGWAVAGCWFLVAAVMHMREAAHS